MCVETYGVASGILLLSTDDLTAALGGVERRLSPDDGLAIGTTAATDALANLDGVGIPVGHDEGSVVLRLCGVELVVLRQLSLTSWKLAGLRFGEQGDVSCWVQERLSL